MDHYIELNQTQLIYIKPILKYYLSITLGSIVHIDHILYQCGRLALELFEQLLPEIGEIGFPNPLDI